MKTDMRFDSVARADSQAKTWEAPLLAPNSEAAKKMDALVAADDGNPFNPKRLHDAFHASLRARLDGSVGKAYDLLALKMLDAHLQAKGLQIKGLENAQRMDATPSSAMLPRDLEFIQQTPREIRYPDLKSRRNIPISTEAPPGADKITYRELIEYGEAALISHTAQDIPRADVAQTETSVNVRTIACSYGYSLQELAAAAMSGAPLPVWKARAAAKACARTEDRVLFAGDSAAGLVGFNTIAGITPTAVVTGNWIAGGATIDQALEDLQTLITTMILAQGDVEDFEPTELSLSSAEFDWLKRTPEATSVNRLSGLERFKLLNPGINVTKWNRLTTAGAAGVTRAIAYTKNNEFVQGHIPQEMTALAPQLDKLETVIYCYSRIGGVECPKPISIGWMDGL